MRKSLIITLAVGVLFLLLLPRVPTDRDYLLRQTLQRELFPRLVEIAEQEFGGASPRFDAELDGPSAEALGGDLAAFMAEALPSDASEATVGLFLRWELQGRDLRVEGAMHGPTGTRRLEENYRLLGWESLLPPLIAILLAFAFRRTLLCLFAGIWVGAVFLAGGNPFKGFVWVFWDGILQHALLDQFRLEILVFVFGLVGAVGIMSRMGGIAGMLKLVEGAVRGARSAQVFSSLMGFVIFFDDYANTILVGTTMRPLTDRWRVSRERLAYIVDSTAAPVAGLSVLSTWVAYEMSLYADQLPAAGVDQDPYIIFLRTIPFRFYSIFTLILVLMSAASGRSFGPMLKAERRARKGEVSPETETSGATVKVTDRALKRTAMKPGVDPRWHNAVLPLALIILVTVILIAQFGNAEGRYGLDFFDLDYLRGTVLSNTQSTRALALASLAGFVLALLLARGQRILGWREALAAGVGNFRAMFVAVGILILAWVMGHICDLLGTSHALIAMSSGGLTDMALLFPLILFLTGAAVSFATGSSWSTMAILLPNVVLLASSLGEGTPLGSEGLLLLSIGAVLEGSIFGDHCSPISDTTILSSVASGCPHMAHVKTQIPFALTSLVVAILAGYLPVFFGLPPWWGLLLGAGMLYAFLRLRGRVPAADAKSPDPARSGDGSPDAGML